MKQQNLNMNKPNKDPTYKVNSSEISKLKSKMKAEKDERYKKILQNLEEPFIRDQKRLN